jgi:hypothetical protein
MGPNMASECIHEDLLSHLHLSDYNVPNAQHSLLESQEWLESLSHQHRSQLLSQGFRQRELLFASARRPSGESRMLSKATSIACAELSGTFSVSIEKAGGGLQNDAAAIAAMAAFEDRALAARRLEIKAWEAVADHALAADSLSIASLEYLVGESSPTIDDRNFRV